MFGAFQHHGVWGAGVRLMRRMNFGAKVGVVGAVMLLPLLGLISWNAIDQHATLSASRTQAAREQVWLAHGIVALAHSMQSTKGLSEKQAQEMAIYTLSTLPQRSADLFWTSNAQLYRVAPLANAGQASAIDAIDSSITASSPMATAHEGNAAKQTIVKHVSEVVARTGDGVSRDLWSGNGQTEASQKLSYVKAFAPWGWIIGATVDTEASPAFAAPEQGWTITIVALALLLGAYLLGSMLLVIKGGFREVSARLKAMTDGDLTNSPTPWGSDEAGRLMLDLSVMQGSLRRIVTEVRDASLSLHGSSNDVNTASINLSERSINAGNNLKISAAALSDISDMVRLTTVNTLKANELALKNSDTAQQGTEVIRKTVRTMDEISSSSSKITEIIAVIDGIAFQTNILALNAAVEAARAGEQGRGFAVVASEVRSLAGRSADAAKEVRSLISLSVEKAGVGTTVVKGAGEIMSELASSAETMQSLLEEVTVASKANSQGLDQLRQSMSELDRMTQQNSDVVADTAAAAQSLRGHSAGVAAAVAAFKLTSDAGGMKRKKLSAELTTSPQISIADLAKLKSEGFRSIICNRPDAEGPGQTRFGDIEQAAKELGMQVRHLPIEPGKANGQHGELFGALLKELPKPILAYCRTGMRSETLWKLSHPGQRSLES